MIDQINEELKNFCSLVQEDEIVVDSQEEYIYITSCVNDPTYINKLGYTPHFK